MPNIQHAAENRRQRVLDEAFAAVGRGWSVIPLYGLNDDLTCACPDGASCKKPGKHPVMNGWDRRVFSDPQMVKGFFSKQQNINGKPTAMNYGIVTGAPSGLVVLDLDDGGEESLAQFEIPETVESLTGGGGRHLLFRHPGAPVKTMVALMDGVDVRADGGFVVGPGSQHVSGRHYEWEISSHPDEVTPADMPLWLFELLEESENGGRRKSKEIPERISAGQRNASLTSFAGSMRRPGMGEEEIYAALKVANETRCDPPLADDEVRRIAGSVAGYEPKSVNGVEEARSRILTVRSVADAFLEPPPEPDELVGGFLRAGEQMVLGGPRALGKSWFLMDLALMLARGEGDFLNRLPVRRSARVLYCNGELREWQAYRRWHHLCEDEKPPEHLLESFDQWRVRSVRRRLFLSKEEGGPGSEDFIEATVDGRLERAIAEHEIEVLVLDPWASFFLGNENSNSEVEAALSEFRRLILTYDVATVIAHHFSKTIEPRESEDLWRGASRLPDWASTRVTMLQHYSQKDAKARGMSREQARRFVDLTFLRRDEPLDDFSITRDRDSGWWRYWDGPEREANEQSRIRIPLTELIEAAKKVGGSFESVNAAASALRVHRDVAKRELDLAVEDGYFQPFEGRKRGSNISIGYRLMRES